MAKKILIDIIQALADSTTAVQITKADGTTPVVTVDTTNSRVGVGLTPTAKLHLQAGGIAASSAPLKLTQASAALLTNPEAGAIECNDGDNLYYTIKTGAERKEIQLYDTYYGEMYMYDNVTACEIDTANTYHAILHSFGNNDGTLPPTTNISAFTFKAGEHYPITSVTDPGGGTTITCVTNGHLLLAGEPITITGSVNYNGIYLVLAAGLTATEFRVTKAYVATNTGSARRPATLKCLAGGAYSIGFTVSGTCETVNDILKFELVKDTTMLDNISCRVLWSTGTNYRSGAGSGNISLTAGQYVWMVVRNYSGVGDLTINNANVSLRRI